MQQPGKIPNKWELELFKEASNDFINDI